MTDLLQIVLFSAAVAAGYCCRLAIERRAVVAMRARLAMLNEKLQHCQQQLQEVHGSLTERESALQFANTEVNRLSAAVEVAHSEMRQQREFAAERLRLLEHTNNEYARRFESISARVFADSQQHIAELADSQFGAIIKPLQDQLQDFKRCVEDTYHRESSDRIQLKTEIVQLKTLNERISADAINLTNALRGDNKALGNWGEVVLERVLETAGLQRGREYFRESSFSDRDGRRKRPDVVLQLPGKRHVVIDSKVSIKAYERSLASTTSTERKRWIRQHVGALRKHVSDLSGKEYEFIGELDSMDFVLMFIPVEAAFMAALEADETLYRDAFEADVLLVGPGSLMATCRAIHNIWRIDRQNRNARQIARKAGEMVDKFSAFTAELDKLGSALAAADSAFESAQRKLTGGRGNLLGRAEELRALGAVCKSTAKA